MGSLIHVDPSAVYAYLFLGGGGRYAERAVEILVPGPEIKPTSPAVEVQRS